MTQPHTTDELSFPLSEIFHKFSSADLNELKPPYTRGRSIHAVLFGNLDFYTKQWGSCSMVYLCSTSEVHPGFI